MDDLALPQHHRSGAHRARRHPLLVVLLTLGAVGLLSAVLLWALLSLDVLGVGDELRQAGGGSSVEAVDPSAGPSVVASQAAPSNAAATSDEASTGASGEAPGEQPEGVVDRSLPLDVLNSTGTPGLASAAAAELVTLGWTMGEVGNYGDDEVETTVLYPEQSQQATAEAVVEDLGVGSVTSSEDVAAITVVLGPDYPG